jgi:hypothetical protein
VLFALLVGRLLKNNRCELLVIGLDGEGEFIGSGRQIQGNRDGAIHELSGTLQNN